MSKPRPGGGKEGRSKRSKSNDPSELEGFMGAAAPGREVLTGAEAGVGVVVFAFSEFSLLSLLLLVEGNISEILGLGLYEDDLGGGMTSFKLAFEAFKFVWGPGTGLKELNR
jgi:hypothetical protein